MKTYRADARKDARKILINHDSLERMCRTLRECFSSQPIISSQFFWSEFSFIFLSIVYENDFGKIFLQKIYTKFTNYKGPFMLGRKIPSRTGKISFRKGMNAIPFYVTRYKGIGMSRLILKQCCFDALMFCNETETPQMYPFRRDISSRSICIALISKNLLLVGEIFQLAARETQKKRVLLLGVISL